MKSWHRWLILVIVFVSVFAIIMFKSDTQKPDGAADLTQKPGSDAVICDTLEIASNAENAPNTPSVEQQKEAIPRMLELGSVGCRPCEMMAPITEELSREFEGKLSVEFYDVKKDLALARQYHIRVIPTQIFLDAEGNEFFRHEGFFPKEEILKVLSQMGVSN